MSLGRFYPSSEVACVKKPVLGNTFCAWLLETKSIDCGKTGPAQGDIGSKYGHRGVNLGRLEIGEDGFFCYYLPYPLIFLRSTKGLTNNSLWLDWMSEQRPPRE